MQMRSSLVQLCYDTQLCYTIVFKKIIKWTEINISFLLFHIIGNCVHKCNYNDFKFIPSLWEMWASLYGWAISGPTIECVKI